MGPLIAAVLLAGSTEAPSTLEVRSDPRGAAVALDGRPIGATPLRLQLAPGLRRIEVAAAGRRPLVLEHIAEPGAARAILVHLARPARARVGAALAGAGAALAVAGATVLAVTGAEGTAGSVLGGALAGAGILLTVGALGPLLSGTAARIREIPILPAALRGGAAVVTRIRF